MSKIYIKACQKYNGNSYCYEGKALMVDNKIIYNDNGSKMIIELLNNRLLVTKKTFDSTIKFTLKENESTQMKCIYQGIEINIPIVTNYLRIKPNQVETKYLIENEIHEYTFYY